MIDHSHSPISSLDGQDQALYTGRGGHLGFLCTEGGGRCGLHLHRPWPLKGHCKFDTHWIQDGRP